MATRWLPPIYSRRCSSVLRAKFEQTQQHFIAIRFQLGNRAGTDFGMNTVDQSLLNLGRQLRLSENLPPGRHRTRELLKEMLDTPLSTAQVIQHQLSHHAPPQARPPPQGGIYVTRPDHPLGNEMIYFASQRRLQAVRDMPGHLFQQPYG